MWPHCYIPSMRFSSNTVWRLRNLLDSSSETHKQSRIFESSCCLLIVSVLIVLALNSFDGLVYKAKRTEIFAALVPVMHEAVITHAFTGVWPTATESNEQIINQSYRSRYTPYELKTSAGDFTIRYEVDPKVPYTESYRLITYSRINPTVFWTCGYEKPRDDEVVAGVNFTSTPLGSLPHQCK